MSPKRGDAPSRPGKSSAAQRQSILVFTEGKKTEPVYLTHWHRMHRERVIVTVDEFHGAPLQLVETAAAQRSADLRTARRGKGDAYHQYWCVFRNISHVTADALVHHRAGTAVSRQRRPRLPDPEIPFRLPDWARNDRVLLEAIEAHLAREEEFQDWLRQHINFHDPRKSWPEKKSKSAFTRWFLPHGATTDVIWTANIRALRDIIEIMTAPDAEEPTRAIFAKVSEIMKAECPILFGPRRK